MTFRYKLTVEYDGSGFYGWQRQEDGRPTIQQALERAVERFCGATCEVVGSGRTDAGVHAVAQVAHVDLPQEYEGYTVMSAINFHLLPARIAVTHAERVADDFSARFSAVKRHYLYRILNRRARPGLMAGYVWHVPEARLDETAMHDAAQRLLGQHDFTSFRDTQCQAKSPVRTLDQLDVTREGDEVHIRTSARSFLHHQVRILTGSLKLVGLGKWSSDDLTSALAARSRSAAGPTAPPDGLSFMRVEY